MSLRYIIDAYNLANNALFKPKTKSDYNLPETILSFIILKKPTISRKNKIVLVFDGFPQSQWRNIEGQNAEMIFSRKISADERIKRLIEESGSRKNIIVVSSDRELCLIAKSLGASVQSIEEFFSVKKKSSQSRAGHEAAGLEELSFSQKHKINEELIKIWLK